MDMRRRVGLNLKRERSIKGWSQEELADQSGLHRTYISGLERGLRNPTIVVLGKLATALGVSAGKLVDGPAG
jgi:transcriptional regulator with XRE-family HTH domain